MRTLLAILLLCAPLAARADPIPNLVKGDPVEKIFKCTENPCVIKNNRGGKIRAFEAAADEIRVRGWMLNIDGGCYSACVISADMLRKYGRVCITERAVFYFHKAFDEEDKKMAGGKVVTIKTNFQNPPHELDLALWNFNKGGYPKDGFNRMPYTQAKKFWPTCFPLNGLGLY